MNIKIEKTNKQISSIGGLSIFSKLWDEVYPDSNYTAGMVPNLKSGLSRSLEKVRQLGLGFIASAQCLDDMTALSADSGFAALQNRETYTPKSFGDFLRSFHPENCRKLNQQLCASSFAIRESLFPNKKSIILDIDSTSHLQHGRKMQGVEKNYKGIDCLDSVQVFDELGLQYWTDVRPGATHTAKGSQVILHEILSYSKIRDKKVIVRADSGYCNRNFFASCSVKKADFIVCMRKMMSRPLMKRVAVWDTQNLEDEDRIRFKNGRECEIGETQYKPKNSPHTYKVIALRSLKTDAIDKLFRTEDDYDYQAWITSIEDVKETSEIVEIYRKRGHAENFIRELKNGFDLQHFPCQNLIANEAYALIAAMAYNLMRLIALKKDPNAPSFSKAIRFCLVNIPCQVVRHARAITFRFMDFHLKEVRKWLVEIALMKVSVPIRSTKSGRSLKI